MKTTLLKVFIHKDNGIVDLRYGAQSYEGSVIVNSLATAARENTDLFAILMQTTSVMLANVQDPEKRKQAHAKLLAAANLIVRGAENLDENLNVKEKTDGGEQE